MGLCIYSAGICDNKDEFSSIKLATEAGKACLTQAGVNKADVDLLINVGVYRDKNILEPAMASLIQKEINLNNDPKETFATHTTFSFDMSNGLPSFVNAMEVVDSMIKNGETKYAIIVASDTHPSQTKHPNFPYRNFGGALLLSKNGKSALNQYFYKNSGNGYTGLKARTKVQLDGNKVVNFEFEDNYTEKLKEFTINSVKEAVAAKKLDLSDVKAVIASQPCKNFGRSIAEAIGLSGDMAIDTYDQYGDTYSSALILGYKTGIEQGRITKNDKVLFVAAGSGLSVGCCIV